MNWRTAGVNRLVVKMQPTAYLIFLRPDGLLLSKKAYLNWREIQDEFDDYMASLGPWSETEIAEHFASDYGEDDVRWPFSKSDITRFFLSNEVTYPSH
jgi:hypothetical protein